MPQTRKRKTDLEIISEKLVKLREIAEIGEGTNTKFLQALGDGQPISLGVNGWVLPILMAGEPTLLDVNLRFDLKGRFVKTHFKIDIPASKVDLGANCRKNSKQVDDLLAHLIDAVNKEKSGAGGDQKCGEALGENLVLMFSDLAPRLTEALAQVHSKEITGSKKTARKKARR